MSYSIVEGNRQMILEAEIETYNGCLSDLLADEGKYVLIQKTKILGTFDTYNDAIKAGYERCGLEPFLVKQIQAVDQVHFITRELGSCPT